MVSVSEIELGNNRVSNRDIPHIHYLVDCQIHSKSTWNRTSMTSLPQSKYDSMII
jgi:hypothetical protein